MKYFISKLVVICIATTVYCLFVGCRHGQPPMQHSPVLNYETPVYDATTNTFSLEITADSVDGAEISYSLTADGILIEKNRKGRFDRIPPFDEGYDVIMEAQWKDTTIFRSVRILGFVAPQEQIDKMTVEELEALINKGDACLRRGTHPQLVQGVKLAVVESKMSSPQMLSDVVTFIENGVWKAVEVVNLDYNKDNQIVKITLKPVGENVAIDDDDEDLDY